MDLALLNVFKTVVDEGGVSAAARRLHRVPSNVSTRIRQLERELGVDLFVRDRRRLHLAPAGELLVDYADRMLATWDEAKTAIGRDAPRGALRIGTLESTAASRLPGVLAEYHERHGGVRMELVTGTTDALIDAVVTRELNAAFVADFDGAAALESAPAFREELVVLTARDHPPIRRPRDVRTDTAIAFPSGCAYRRRLQRWLARDGIVPRRTMELGSYHAIVACTASGAGIALAPRSVLDTIRHSEVTAHALPKSVASSVVSMVWRQDRSSPALTSLRELLAARRRSPRGEAHGRRKG